MPVTVRRAGVAWDDSVKTARLNVVSAINLVAAVQTCIAAPRENTCVQIVFCPTNATSAINGFVPQLIVGVGIVAALVPTVIITSFAAAVTVPVRQRTATKQKTMSE